MLWPISYVHQKPVLVRLVSGLVHDVALPAPVLLQRRVLELTSHLRGAFLPKGSSCQKLVEYTVDALEARFAGTCLPSDNPHAKPPPVPKVWFVCDAP